MNEEMYNELVDMLSFNDDLHLLIEDCNFDYRIYNYWKHLNIIDIAGILEYISTDGNVVHPTILKFTIRRIYNINEKKVLTYIKKMKAIEKIHYYEKQIELLKKKYGI